MSHHSLQFSTTEGNKDDKTVDITCLCHLSEMDRFDGRWVLI